MINNRVLYNVGDHAINKDGEDCLVTRAFNDISGVYYDMTAMSFFGNFCFPKTFMSVEQGSLVNNIRYRSMSPKFNSVFEIDISMNSVNNILHRYIEKMYPVYTQDLSKFKIFLIFKLRQILVKNVHVSIVECSKTEIFIRFYEYSSETDHSIKGYVDTKFDMISLGRLYKIKTLL